MMNNWFKIGSVWFTFFIIFWKDSDIILTLNDRYDEHLYVFF